jgi:hypothetical protein
MTSFLAKLVNFMILKENILWVWLTEECKIDWGFNLELILFEDKIQYLVMIFWR